jgi:uncharacterized protein DUF929
MARPKPRPPVARKPGAGDKGPRLLRKPVSRRPTWLPAAATVGGIVLIVVALFAYKNLTAPAPPVISPSSAELVIATITNLPPIELEQVGAGSANNLIKKVTGTPLTGSDGKPEIFYLGAEYCPFCAAERWPMIIALSRFGAFAGLQTTTSSSTDTFPNTPTFTFRSATFTSQYIDFQSVEETDRNRNPLRSPTPFQQALVSQYDTSGSIPFVDLGNRYAFAGAMYSPDTLSGMTWQQVADSLQSPSSAQAKAILGSANLITAAICQLSGQKPAPVCSGPSIQAIATKLG